MKPSTAYVHPPGDRYPREHLSCTVSWFPGCVLQAAPPTDVKASKESTAEESERWWRIAEMELGLKEQREGPHHRPHPAKSEGEHRSVSLGASDSCQDEVAPAADTAEYPTSSTRITVRVRGQRSDTRGVDYSKWEHWLKSPDDPATAAELASREAALDKLRDEEFERNNPGFCNQFKEDMEKRRKRQEEKQQQAALLKAKGNTAFKRKEYDTALALYHEALVLQPLLYPVLTNIAAVHQAKGEWSEAEEFGHRALHVDPYNSKGYYRRGCAARSGGFLTASLFDFGRGVSVCPTSTALTSELLDTWYTIVSNEEKSAVGCSASNGGSGLQEVRQEEKEGDAVAALQVALHPHGVCKRTSASVERLVSVVAHECTASIAAWLRNRGSTGDVEATVALKIVDRLKVLVDALEGRDAETARVLRATDTPHALCDLVAAGMVASSPSEAGAVEQQNVRLALRCLCALCHGSRMVSNAVHSSNLWAAMLSCSWWPLETQTVQKLEVGCLVLSLMRVLVQCEEVEVYIPGDHNPMRVVDDRCLRNLQPPNAGASLVTHILPVVFGWACCGVGTGSQLQEGLTAGCSRLARIASTLIVELCPLDTGGCAVRERVRALFGTVAVSMVGGPGLVQTALAILTPFVDQCVRRQEEDVRGNRETIAAILRALTCLLVHEDARKMLTRPLHTTSTNSRATPAYQCLVQLQLLTGTRWRPVQSSALAVLANGCIGSSGDALCVGLLTNKAVQLLVGQLGRPVESDDTFCWVAQIIAVLSRLAQHPQGPPHIQQYSVVKGVSEAFCCIARRVLERLDSAKHRMWHGVDKTCVDAFARVLATCAVPWKKELRQDPDLGGVACFIESGAAVSCCQLLGRGVGILSDGAVASWVSADTIKPNLNGLGNLANVILAVVGCLGSGTRVGKISSDDLDEIFESQHLVTTLLELVKNGSGGARKNAAVALARLSKLPKCGIALRASGGMQVLLELGAALC